MMRQFFTSLQQIAHSDSVGTVQGVYRHLQWQMRRLLNEFPCDLSLAESTLRVERPGGVAALVNAMGAYDFNNMHFIRALLERLHGAFVDVGANIGAYTLIASEVREAIVVSVEPHPRTFASLTENVRLNRRYNVICVNAALSTRDGQAQLTDEAQPELNHIVQAPEENAVHVASRRFDNVCDVLRVSPDIVKIDVEGHQRAVLDGFGEYRDRVKAIVIEDGDQPEVRRWMADGGYAGPYFVHFKRRRLSELRQARPEDPVYVNRGFLSGLCRAHFPDGTLDFSEFLEGSSDAAGVTQWR
jgi:FkbM family methyltransferase